MLRSLILALSFFVVSALPAAAQTGPSGGSTPAPSGVAPASQAMTPDRLAGWLRQKGHTADVKTLANGVRMVGARIQKDGWGFDVQFEFTTDGKIMNLICVLGGAESYSRTQLYDLLKRNYDFGGPRHFSIRGADQRLCLEDNGFSTSGVNDGNLQNIVDNFLRLVRDTHPLWGTPAGA
jgi:hypothetical protein